MSPRQPLLLWVIHVCCIETVKNKSESPAIRTNLGLDTNCIWYNSWVQNLKQQTWITQSNSHCYFEKSTSAVSKLSKTKVSYLQSEQILVFTQTTYQTILECKVWNSRHRLLKVTAIVTFGNPRLLFENCQKQKWVTCRHDKCWSLHMPDIKKLLSADL